MDDESRPPLDQRPPRRGRGRTGIPRAIVRRDIFDGTVTPFAAAPVAPPRQPTPTTIPEEDTTSSSESDEDSGEHARAVPVPRVTVFTRDGELIKRARASTSTSSGSDGQEDKRLKLSTTQPRRSLAPPSECADTPRSPSPRTHPAPRERRPPTPPPCDTRALARAVSAATPPHLSAATATNADQAMSSSPSHSGEGPISRSRSPQFSSTSQSAQATESASWSKNSTSYAGLASPTARDTQMDVSRPTSPQPSTSYAAAAAAPASPRRPPPPTTEATTAVPQPTPRSTYPPIVVECLPNWTRHFEALRRTLGYAPNARPLGRGVRFLPKDATEFRAVQRYLVEAASQDRAVSWHCYSPANEVPTKVAIRGLPLETPTDEVVEALCALGYPAEAARAIPPTARMHGCTYYVRLAHLNQEELRELYKTTELLNMPRVTVEAWRGGSKPPQCHRCQAYGHNSANCYRPPRCVRCAGEHLVRECNRRRDEDPTCANCGLCHAANDRRCAHFKREARRRGIQIPPPAPRASSRNQPPRAARAAPYTPAATASRGSTQRASQSLAATAPAASTTEAAPRAPLAAPAAGPAAAPVATPSGAPTAPTALPVAPTRPRTTAEATITATTLMAAANPPTERSRRPRKKKRRGQRAPRPARAEPTAASTPQPRQSEAAAAAIQPQPRQSEAAAAAAQPQPPTAGAITAPTVTFAAPANRHTALRVTRPPAPASTSAAPPSQGEAQTSPDITAIVRVVVEAIMTGLTTYLQGQGAMAAIAAGVAVLTRLGHS